MKKVNKFLNGLGWLKYVVYTLFAGVVVYVLVVLFKAIRGLMNGVTDVTGSLGITKTTGYEQAHKEVGNQVWGTDLATKHPSEVTLSADVLLKMAADIYDSWGFWSQDFDTTIAVFKKCHNKYDVSALCQCFVDKYNKDLLDYITPYSWLAFKLRFFPSSDQFNEINNFVKNLPD